jgi:hypothetical protein
MRPFAEFIMMAADRADAHSPPSRRACPDYRLDGFVRWLSVQVFIAAFEVASLLTMAAVARRASDVGSSGQLRVGSG